MTVPDDQSPSRFIPTLRAICDEVVVLGVHGSLQHPPDHFADNLIERATRRAVRSKRQHLWDQSHA